jgi:hypothetical protein
MIVLDDSAENLGKIFNSIEFVGRTTDNRYALEKDLPIFVCKNPKEPDWLQKEWPRLKKWR